MFTIKTFTFIRFVLIPIQIYTSAAMTKSPPNDRKSLISVINYHAFLPNTDVSQQQTPSIYGGKPLLLPSADAELSFYCPSPSSSLPSAPRLAAEASWNIRREGGRVREGDVKMQSGQEVALLFSGSPRSSFQSQQRSVLSPQAVRLK